MKRIIALLILAFIVFIPYSADAHASLLDAYPVQYEQIQKAPKQILLTFNERLQDELYYIKVYDDDGKLVSKPKTNLSKDHKKLSVDLLPLKPGTYTVSYHIISADGHTIESSYLFTYGTKKSAVPTIPSNFKNNTHSHGGYQFLFYGAYYILFLAFAGWILLGIMRRETITNQKTEWYKALKFFFLIACVLLSLIEYRDAVSGFGNSQWSTFFLHTSTGIIAGISVILAILGQFILQKSRVIDGIWFVAIILLEAYNGHAATFAPVPVTVGLDAIHLMGAALWVGGLLYLGIHFRKHAPGYLAFFSKWAFISLVVLVITGSITTLIFTPDLAALTKSTWGILLILKVFVVLLVYLIAAIIRSRLKAVNPHSTRNWLKVDVVMMLIILIIVGGMTHESPFPTNKPLEWQTTKNGYDVSTLVYPTNPSVTNTFSVTISSATEQVENIDLILRNEDKKDLAPFEVPLKKVKSNPKSKNTLVTYEAKGAFISIPGKWQLELQIYDQNDNYTIVKKNMAIYRVKQ